jgi:hypothetical protein
MCFAFPSAHSRLSRQRLGDYMQLKKDQFAIPRRPCPGNRGGAHGNCPCLCVDCRLKSGWHPRPSIVLSLRAGLSRHSMTSRSYLKLRAWPLPNMNGQCDQATTRDCLIIDAVLTADESIHRSCRPAIVGERRKQGEYAAL